MVYQHIVDLVALCALKGITDVVISPGSRSAPLTLAVARHASLRSHIVVDERSAAFHALGMAIAMNNTVALICTSGTATLNYAPAIAEAFFSNVPLLVLTADRPADWVAQQDGQTIYQDNIFGRHVAQSFNFPTDISHTDSIWACNRIANTAINLTYARKQPVHINIPLREPLYPTPEDYYVATTPLRVIEVLNAKPTIDQFLMHQLTEVWEKTSKKLIVVSQHKPDLELRNALNALSSYTDVVILADSLSNMEGVDGVITGFHHFLGNNLNQVLLRPDLLITIGGGNILSKTLKKFLRDGKTSTHWHLQPDGTLADPLQSISHHLAFPESLFITKLAENAFFTGGSNEDAKAYHNTWASMANATEAILATYPKPTEDFQELSATKAILDALPDNANLWLSNSMPVRYASYFQIHHNVIYVKKYSNRGTSGIDGCTSTAVGFASSVDAPVIFITGDIGFQYDINGLWRQSLPKNLLIIVMENGGSNIFGLIDGPANLPELDKFYTTNQPKLEAASALDNIAITVDIDSYVGLNTALKVAFASISEGTATMPTILMVHTSATNNQIATQTLKQEIKLALQ